MIQVRHGTELIKSVFAEAPCRVSWLTSTCISYATSQGASVTSI